jgi:hypothetical protein
MALQYAFKADAGFFVKNMIEANPQAVGEELARITAAHDGLLVPIKIIEVARAEKSVLHRHFDWDDAEAAQYWRLGQARHLVSSIRIIDDKAQDRSALTRAYVSITADGVTAYHRVSDVVNNATLQDLLLRQADRELAAFERRYKELTDICSLVQEARQRISERRARQRQGDSPAAAAGA